MILRHFVGEHRLLYIVYECAKKGVYFPRANPTKPLSLCPRGLVA